MRYQIVPACNFPIEKAFIEDYVDSIIDPLLNAMIGIDNTWSKHAK